jgi:hypothetical protein
LLWLLPYTLAAVSAVGVWMLARRWSKAATATVPAMAGGAVDAGLQQQLDDELRDLD